MPFKFTEDPDGNDDKSKPDKTPDNVQTPRKIEDDTPRENQIDPEPDRSGQPGVSDPHVSIIDGSEQQGTPTTSAGHTVLGINPNRSYIMDQRKRN